MDKGSKHNHVDNYKHKYKKYKSKYTKLKQVKYGGGNGSHNNELVMMINSNNLSAINRLQEIAKLSSNGEKLPVVDLYEYSIDNYTKTKNKFKGFQSSQMCSSISAGEAAEKQEDFASSNISSCDVLASNEDEKVNTSLNVVAGDYMEHFYKHLYNAYKLFKSRSDLIDIATSNDSFCYLYMDHIFNIASKINERYSELTRDIGALISTSDYSYVQVINVHPNDKVIVFGDIHGSLHTFVRILFRLHAYGVIDIETFNINEGYRIVFLGDVVDRGNFSIEIVFAILLLIYNNNKDVSNPKIIYNRGNHEEVSVNTSQGFLKELSARCSEQNGRKLHETINDLFKKFPSAAILQVVLNGAPYRLWLSHGGFPLSYVNPGKCTDQYANLIPLNMEDGKQTRWADFYQYISDSSKHFVPNVGRGVKGDDTSTNLIILNRKHVAAFLDNNRINFIIRGHQDNYYNSYLFANVCQNRNVCAASIMCNSSNSNNIAIYNNKIKLIQSPSGSRLKTLGPTARLVVDKNKFNRGVDAGEGYYLMNMGATEVYPVLTLSTNTDRDRGLQSDSFAIVRFDLTLEDLSDFDKGTLKNLYSLPSKLNGD
jgi:hypothetical protein